MNKTKKVLIGFLCAMAVTAGTVGFAACGHEHDYGWKNDGATHWQECKCGDKINESAHVDVKNNETNADGSDYKCDVCGVILHTHEYSDELSYNATHHWYAATCGHTDEVKDKAEHDFTNGNCICGKKKEFTVTFDSKGGSAVSSAAVENGDVVAKPENPTRDDYCFEGWYNGETKYDFAAEVTSDITLDAHWTSVTDINAAFTQALSADYSNFTSASTYTDESGFYTDVFKQDGNKVYWASGTALYDDHIVIFTDAGTMLAMYYLHEDEWKKSGLITYADFIVALYLNEISASDVEYSEGVYHVLPDSISSVVYALFRSTETYSDFYIQIENGRISKVGGTIADVTHVQTFYAFDETEITLPDDLPAVTVNITTKNKEIEAGKAVDKAELIDFLFTVKAEDRAYPVTEDMIDFGELDFDNPQVGTYPVTISFDTFDGATHSETATVTVALKGDETFAQVFAKDYTNLTFINSAITSVINKYVNGVYSIPNAILYIESDGSLTKYSTASTSLGSETKNAWQALPRFDLLFALDADLFEQVGDTSVYTVNNNESIVDVLAVTTMTKATVVNTKRDYSIKLTIEVGRIAQIEFSYYSLSQSTTATASNGALRTLTYTLSKFGTTEFEIPDEIVAKRPAETAVQADYIDEKRYNA